jgi:superfamily II helicase
LIAEKARFRSARKLERLVGYRLPVSAFHGTTLEAISARLNFDYLDPSVRTQLLSFFDEFLRCSCKESPLCDCPARKFAALIIDLRERGLDHRQISSYLLDEFGIEIYPADVLSYLEDSVHVLEAIRDIACLDKRDALEKKANEHISLIAR